MLNRHLLEQLPDDPRLHHALRMQIYDGICSHTMNTLTIGAFLIAYGLAIGAGNVVIGFVAALPTASQVLQIPAIYIVNRFRNRRRIVVAACVLGRAFWPLLALSPWIVPQAWLVPFMVVAVSMVFGLHAISNCAWNSWMRDLVPDSVMGRFFARRNAVSMIIAAAIGLPAAFLVDFAGGGLDALPIFSLLFTLGGVAGFIGCYFLAVTHEPPLAHHDRTVDALRHPIRDENYRRVLVFLGLWSGAVNMALPFFTVYMLERLHISMTLILLLTGLTQVVNAAFFQLWGNISDRLGDKAALGAGGLVFLGTFLLWPLCSLFEHRLLVLMLLVSIHLLTGLSMACVNLSTVNLALKAAPVGRATAYLAVNALISGAAATVAPMAGGALADFVDGAEFSHAAPGLLAYFSGYDYLFIAAFGLGLLALHRLAHVNEPRGGTAPAVWRELAAQTLGWFRGSR